MPRKPYIALGTVIVFLSSAFVADAQRRKKKEDEEPVTQTLELPPDPPAAVVADTQRLTFHVAPMTNKGLLSKQVREGLKALFRLTRGSQIVKIRAFVAGTGDVRRVQTIVSEEFAEKRQAVPAVTVVQVGALPMEGAQVVLTAVAVAKKPVNPHGLAFVSGQAAVSKENMMKAAPLVEKSVTQLRNSLAGAGIPSSEVQSVTCFVSSLEDYSAASPLMQKEFPRAAAVMVQLQRIPYQGIAECEAVARLTSPPDSPLKLLNPEGAPKPEQYSQLALVGAPKVALSGAQLAFRAQEEDARLAFQRLERSLEAVHASLRNAAMCNYYPLTARASDTIRKIRFEFLDKQRPPASTLLLFEGLPSLDASFAIEVVAAVP